MKRLLLVLLLFCIVLGCKKESSVFVEVQFTVAVPESTRSNMVSVSLFDTVTGEARGGFFMSNYICKSESRIFSQLENIRPGQYTVVAYNMDAPGVEVRGEGNLSTFEFITRADSDSTVTTPGELAASKVFPVSLSKGSSVNIVCPPVTTSTTIYLGAKGLQYATGKYGCVHGFGTSYFLDSGKAAASEILSFDIDTATSDSLTATIYSFGELGPQYNFIFTVNTSGGIYKYLATTDSTFRFPGSIDIPAPSPGPGTGKDGFNPEVGQWNDYSVIVPV